MITTWQEIDSRFDAIKDHRPKAAKKLKELGEILASAYLLDAEKASNMWQYLVDLNVDDNKGNAKFYVAQVFKKIQDSISSVDAVALLAMEPDRVFLLFQEGYEGKNLYICLNTVVESFLMLDNLDNAISVVEIFADKYGGMDSTVEELKLGVICLGIHLLNMTHDGTAYQDSIFEFFDALQGYTNPMIASFYEIMAALACPMPIKSSALANMLDACFEWKFEPEFLRLLYVYRDQLATEDIVNWLENYCDCLEPDAPAPRRLNWGICEEPYVSNAPTEWYAEIIMQSPRLLDKYFKSSFYYDTVSCCILRKWLETEQYEHFLEAFVGLILNIQDDRVFNRIMYDFKYMSWTDSQSENGLECSIFGGRFSDKLADTIAHISAMLVASPYHKTYHKEIKKILFRKYGDYSLLNKYGFNEQVSTATAEEEFVAYIRKHGQTNPPTNHAHEILKLYRAAVTEYGRINGYNQMAKFGHGVASNQELATLLCCNICHAGQIKAEMIIDSIVMGDSELAFHLVEQMLNTTLYFNYTELQAPTPALPMSWEIELKETAIQLIEKVKQNQRDFYSGYHTKTYETIRAMVNSAQEIVKKIIPCLNRYDVIEVQGTLLTLEKEKALEAEYIAAVMDTVKAYTTFPKPKGYISIKDSNIKVIKDSLRLLSQMGRVDILSIMLNQLYEARQKLTPITFDGWLYHIRQSVQPEDCCTLFRENRQIFREWIVHPKVNKYDYAAWGNKINRANPNAFEEFASMVYELRGIDIKQQDLC